MLKDSEIFGIQPIQQLIKNSSILVKLFSGAGGVNKENLWSKTSQVGGSQTLFQCCSTDVQHPEGTSIGSDNCDFLKVSDFNGSLWNVKVFPLKII